jgi:large repetitive protein
MSRPSRIVKRLLLPALLALALIAVQVVVAAPPQPSFRIDGPNASTTCGLYTFTSTSTDPDDDIATVDWDIAGTAMTGSSVTETFATPGPRTINMTVTDTDAADGTVDPVQATPQTVTVGNGGNPHAAFSPSANPVEPNTSVTFNSSSTALGSGSITKYEWDLDGNGTYETDTGATPSATQAAG